jgi:hypothetical protein
VDAWVEPPWPSPEDLDAHCPFEWLTAVVAVTKDLLEGCPYLFPEPERVAHWAPTCANPDVLHMGLHWIADQQHSNAGIRTMRLADLAPLFELRRIRWYSLQKGAAPEVAAYPEVIDLGEVDAPDAKFVETAAIVSQLDAVCCIDSSIGHLAGALGRRVFMLLPVLADPQWGVANDGQAWWSPSTHVRRVRPCDVDGL